MLANIVLSGRVFRYSWGIQTNRILQLFRGLGRDHRTARKTGELAIRSYYRKLWIDDVMKKAAYLSA
jgi:hypothetical protein